MHEDLLQFVWSKGLFNANHLKTTNGLPLQIESRGSWNTIAGPDFPEARVRIGDTLWIGSVEIHTRSSEWIRHEHHTDVAYNSVILHVVYEHDIEVQNSKGETIPVLELNGRISSHVIGKYETLRAASEKIPCGRFFKEVPKIQFISWLDRLLVLRLERKSGDIDLIHRHHGQDWLQTFYVLFAGYLGQNRNKLPFQELTRVLPINLLLKYVHYPLQVEAMLFGVAGLLPGESGEVYIRSLIEEYKFLKTKHNLHEITQQWRFGGIRPGAFPTVRIAQLAALVPHMPEIQARMISKGSHLLEELPLTIDAFWQNHYTFTKGSARTWFPGLSPELVQLLTINALAPYLFYYARSIGDQPLADHAVTLLQAMKPEQNAITASWAKMGHDAENASETQALIELTTQFCNVKKCVLCNVGRQLISAS